MFLANKFNGLKTNIKTGLKVPQKRNIGFFIGMIVGSALTGGTKTGRQISGTLANTYNLVSKRELPISGINKDNMVKSVKNTLSGLERTIFAEGPDLLIGIEPNLLMPTQYKFNSKNSGTTYNMYIGPLNQKNEIKKFVNAIKIKDMKSIVNIILESQIPPAEDKFESVKTIKKNIQSKLNDAGLYIYELTVNVE